MAETNEEILKLKSRIRELETQNDNLKNECESCGKNKKFKEENEELTKKNKSLEEKLEREKEFLDYSNSLLVSERNHKLQDQVDNLLKVISNLSEYMAKDG